MKNIISKLTTLTATAAAGFVLFAGIASAHVTVKPAVSAPKAWETYTIKIPTEKDIPTTKVTLKIPADVDFKSYQPVPGWNVTTEKDSSGKVTSVTWSTTGKGIDVGQFEQFNFVAQNPSTEEQIPWNAFQYYSDGSVVEWTGEEGADTPHSITQIVTPAAEGNAPAATTGHDHAAADTTQTADQNKAATGNQSTSLVLSIISIVLSLIAVLLGLRRKK
ncbi:DUF1775 domain-containing protein [Paenibacillus sediminis]|uniref:LPXTG-motif cell wall-anchored protein n=1 Tax=Paenibacillus sediminis TaxID=664909 RepID=A0ABS4H3K8_9BACL|nr:DUF1775 domain-containing protein [Paenibacillus sediminis]MBP1936972.1 LPXTG-motif cell wall-anchored protein [Paenibacillus sediminis]